MADTAYTWILDATAGAPLSFVLILLAVSFVVVQAVTVRQKADFAIPRLLMLKEVF